MFASLIGHSCEFFWRLALNVLYRKWILLTYCIWSYMDDYLVDHTNDLTKCVRYCWVWYWLVMDSVILFKSGLGFYWSWVCTFSSSFVPMDAIRQYQNGGRYPNDINVFRVSILKFGCFSNYLGCLGCPKSESLNFIGCLDKWWLNILSWFWVQTIVAWDSDIVYARRPRSQIVRTYYSAMLS